MKSKNEYPLTNWLPIKLHYDNDDLCQWIYFGDKNFTEPFFDETVAMCRVFPENGHLLRSISTVEFLLDASDNVKSINPTGFIFHISRCGSTLVSQILGMQSTNIILSEVPLFDELLRKSRRSSDRHGVLDQLKATIRLYGAQRNDIQKHLFIKLDSWHIHFYDELRGLFPDVPFFFMYREPIEVLLSQRRKRGMQSIPNLIEPEIFGFGKEVLNIIDLDRYMSMVLESFLIRFYDILPNDEYAYQLNYLDGPMEMVETILKICNVPVSPNEKHEMQQRSLYNAKFPASIFSEGKVDEPVPEFLKKSVELYHRIEFMKL